MVAVGGVWVVVGLSVIAIGGGWLALRCSHSGPLGLLPPVVNEAGERLPARWYCDACGRVWPAGIEHGRPPVQKFTGYDPSKAIRAAHRAEELETRQRELAIRRSGIARTSRKYEETPAEPRPSLKPVPITSRRRVS